MIPNHITKIDTRGKKVLIISDTHVPYSHIDYINFLEDIKDRFKPDIVIHIGDEADKHAMSFHPSDPDLMSAGPELDKTIDEFKEGLHRLFPNMFLLESNHGSMLYRKAKVNGTPRRYLKSLAQVYETPQWSWHDEIILETDMGLVYLCHGKTSAYGKLCKEESKSAIQGHFHGRFEITWHQSSTVKKFNMFVGCLVDARSMALAYGKNFVQQPCLGVGALMGNGLPILFPMHVDQNNRWTGKI